MPTGDVQKVKLFLQDNSSSYDLAVSEVTVMELIIGCKNKSDLLSLEKFIKQFTVYGINEKISDKAISLLKLYHLSHGLLIADSLLAATSITLDLQFATKNQKDFRFIKGLKLIEYN